MLPTTSHRKHRQLSPYLYLFIPVAFVLGLGAGYLLWSPKSAAVAADPTGNQRVTVSTDGDPSIGPADAPITIVNSAITSALTARPGTSRPLTS